MRKERENSFVQIALKRAEGAEALNGLSDGIVKSWANLANQLAFPVRPGAVGEQHNRNPRL